MASGGRGGKGGGGKEGGGRAKEGGRGGKMEGDVNWRVWGGER